MKQLKKLNNLVVILKHHSVNLSLKLKLYIGSLANVTVEISKN